MNKRYFIFGLLAISLALCACSSEDQPADGWNKFTFSVPETGSGGSSEPPAEDVIVAGTEGGACLEGGICKEGLGLECNAATGKCQQKITPPPPGPVTCPEGYTLAANTQECVPIKVEPKTCPEGQTLVVETQECVPIKVESKTCPDGQTLVAETQECVAIVVEGSGAWGEKCKNDGTCSDAGLKCKENMCVIDMEKPALFVATGGGGIFTSLDGGQNWIARNVGLDKDPDKYIKSLYYDGGILYAGTNGDGIFNLGDGSQKWGKATDAGLDNKNILSICEFKGRSYAGTNGGGVFKLSKNAWEAKNDGLKTYLVIKSLLCTDAAMYAVTNEGAYTSTDGEKWQPLSAASASTNKKVISLVKFGADIYAGVSDGGVFKLSGGLWVKEQGAEIENKTVTTLGTTKNTMYAGLNGGDVFIRGLAGLIWKKKVTLTGIYDGPGETPPVQISAFVDYNDKIYIGTNGYGIYDLGGVQMNTGLASKNINAMVYICKDKQTACSADADCAAGFICGSAKMCLPKMTGAVTLKQMSKAYSVSHVDFYVYAEWAQVKDFSGQQVQKYFYKVDDEAVEEATGKSKKFKIFMYGGDSAKTYDVSVWPNIDGLADSDIAKIKITSQISLTNTEHCILTTPNTTKCQGGFTCKFDQCVCDPPCVCTPSCQGKLCGSDGCGSICGKCPPGQLCNASQQCVKN